MSAPTSGACRWGWGLDRLVDQVRGGFWEHQILVNAVAARLDVNPEHVSVEVNKHLGRTYLRIEVAA